MATADRFRALMLCVWGTAASHSVVSLGTFDELVATDEDFAHQAALGGLAAKDDRA